MKKIKKSILYITYDGLTDPLGQSQILPYLLELSKENYHFTILSFEKRERFQQSGAKIKELTRESYIEWVPLFFTSNPPIVSKLYDLLQAKRRAIELHQHKKFSLVHCRSYVAGQVGLLLKKKYNIPFVFDMRGFWADEKKESGRWGNLPLLYNHYKQLEKKLLTESAAIVSLTHAAKKEIISWPTSVALENKIKVIPCCADFTHFNADKVDTIKREQLLKSIGLDNKYPVIGYLGSLGAAYGIAEMLAFFNCLKSTQPAAKFLFFTKDDRELVLNLIPKFENINEDDLYFEFVERRNLPTYLSLLDFSIFFYYPSYSRLACSPTKFAELAAMGIPVICNSVGDINEKFLMGSDHIILNDLSMEAMSQSVTRINKLKKPDQSAIREFSLNNYSLKVGVESYRKVYKEVLS